MRTADSEVVTPPKARRGARGGWRPLPVLSRVGVSLDPQVPAWGQALRTEGFKLQAERGRRPRVCGGPPHRPPQKVPSTGPQPCRDGAVWSQRGGEPRPYPPAVPSPWSLQAGTATWGYRQGAGHVEPHPHGLPALCPSLPPSPLCAGRPPPQRALHSSTRDKGRVTGSPLISSGPRWL